VTTWSRPSGSTTSDAASSSRRRSHS
jgi:hypothetical protein